MLTKELKKIKKIYGEDFMKLCRQNFPTILHDKNSLLEILTNTFSTNCTTLAQDLEDEEILKTFSQYIYNKYHEMREGNKQSKSDDIEIVEDPYTLLKEKRYNLYQCITNDEVQEFRKLYETNELPCTFKEDRTKNSVVFFAVKDNVEDIQRKDFENPRIEDDYSLSVLTIQFPKVNNFYPKIVSRYNHSVEQPDSVFGNDLNKLCPNLEKSFQQHLQSLGYVKLPEEICSLELENYVYSPKEKMLYKYNIEDNGVYYCPGNLVLDLREDNIEKYDPNSKIVADNFVVDFENKTISQIQDKSSYVDGFTKDFQAISNITVTKLPNAGKRLTIFFEDEEKQNSYITLNKNNQIVEYVNVNITELPDNFMKENIKLQKIEVPNVEKVGNYCLYNNEQLEEITLEKAKEIGKFFVNGYNESLESVNIPQVEVIGEHCFEYCLSTNVLNANNLKQCGDNFFFSNEEMEEISLNNVEQIRDSFFEGNEKISQIYLPNVEVIGDNFMFLNRKLEEIYAPKLKTLGNYPFDHIPDDRYVEGYCPNITNIGESSYSEFHNTLFKIACQNLLKVNEEEKEKNERENKEVKESKVKENTGGNMEEVIEGFADSVPMSELMNAIDVLHNDNKNMKLDKNGKELGKEEI